MSQPCDRPSREIPSSCPARIDSVEIYPPATQLPPQLPVDDEDEDDGNQLGNNQLIVRVRKWIELVDLGDMI